MKHSVLKKSLISLAFCVGAGHNSYAENNDLQQVNPLTQNSSSAQDSVDPVTAKSDLIIVKFNDASHIKALTAYHESQTQGSYISGEQFAQAQNLLQTLSNAYGADLTIARIARLGAVVLKLSEPVELGELNSRLKSKLNVLDIIKYAEADPYLSVNALQSLEDDFNNAVQSARINEPSLHYRTSASTPYWTHVEPGQEGLTQPQVASWGNQRVQADQLSDAAADQLTICIIDSGYDKYHEDLPHDRVTGNALPDLGDWADEHGHGTHVAGIIAALDNQYGTKGVLPNGRINLNIKRVLNADNTFPGSSAMSTIADTAYDCSEEGSDIISMSLAGSSTNQYVEDTFQAVHDNNVLMVAANGNNGYGPTTVKFYPASLPSVIATGSIDVDNGISGFSNQLAETELVAPGSGIYSTMPVGLESKKYYTVELRINGELYPYSVVNDGRGSDIQPKSITAELVYCSPTSECRPEEVKDNICFSLHGNGPCSVVLDPETGQVPFDENGDRVFTLLNSAARLTVVDFATHETAYFNGNSISISYLEKLNTLVGQTVTLEIDYKSFNDNGYSYASGTSMATPYVSGVAALAWSNNLECTAAEVRTALSASAKDLGEAGWDSAYGYGLVQAKDASDYMREHCAAYNTGTTLIQ